MVVKRHDDVTGPACDACETLIRANRMTLTYEKVIHGVAWAHKGSNMMKVSKVILLDIYALDNIWFALLIQEEQVLADQLVGHAKRLQTRRRLLFALRSWAVLAQEKATGRAQAEQLACRHRHARCDIVPLAHRFVML